MQLYVRDCLAYFYELHTKFNADYEQLVWQNFDNCDTIETRIEEPTFLGDSLLKALIFCLYSPYIRDGESVTTVETRIK